MLTPTPLRARSTADDVAVTVTYRSMERLPIGRCAVCRALPAAYTTAATSRGRTAATFDCGPCRTRGIARALRMLADLLEDA